MNIVSGHEIAVLVCTYRRPEGLLNLLQALAAQVVPHGTRVEVVVVDNDPSASGRAVIPLAPSRWPIAYLVEPRPGIPAARTTALTQGLERELVAFIDDDETPSADWLSELLSAFLASGADGVAGGVSYNYDGQVADWVREGGFFDQPVIPDGADIPFAATGSLMLSSSRLRDLDVIEFDEDYRFTGGSDIAFTQRFVQLGGRIVWCESAKATERVPLNRSTRLWALRRAYRAGNVTAKSNYARATGMPQRLGSRLTSVLGGLARILLAAPVIFAGLAMRRPRLVGTALRKVARGTGIVGAALGHSYEEYRRPALTGAGALDV